MPDAAIMRAATSAPVMPDEAGTSLYFAYAAFTLQVAQSERANVPKKRKRLNAVILVQDTTLCYDIKAIPLCAFFFFSTLEPVFNLEALWGIFFRDTRRKPISTRCSNPPATCGRTIKGCWHATPGCRARNS